MIPLRVENHPLTNNAYGVKTVSLLWIKLEKINNKNQNHNKILYKDKFYLK